MPVSKSGYHGKRRERFKVKVFDCKTAQKGFYAGPVRFICESKQEDTKRTSDSEKEFLRFQLAVKDLIDRIETEKTGGTDKEIREMTVSFLCDPAFLSAAEQGIREKFLTAENAVQEAAGLLADAVGSVSSEYINCKNEDIRSVAQQLTEILSGENTNSNTTAAVCARQLGPAQLLVMEKKRIGGIVTETGSANSHVSILAGSLGVPYLYGNKEAILAAEHAAFIILDGEKGTVIIDPDKKATREARKRMKEIRSRKEKQQSVCSSGQRSKEAVSCGTRVVANIKGPEDISQLLSSGADGVGLFRTEFLFLERSTPPTEQEQYEAYTAVLDAMEGKKVIIRTMDLGSDKRALWLSLPEEANPALGLRGIRVSLEKKELFTVQLRALLRAGVRGNLKVMFPMIASEWEMDAACAMVQETAQALEKEGIPFAVPPLGIMVETPAAAVCADKLARKADFFSIGTNDLTQYTLAADREAEGLENYSEPRHEAVFELIRMAVDGGHRHGITVGVCGQLAADPEAAGKLIELGVDELSVPVFGIQKIKALAVQAEQEISGKNYTEKPLESQTGADDDKVNASAGELGAAADGRVVPMEDIPDAAFSGGSLGRCYGIWPENGRVYAPLAGVVVHIAETCHAITIAGEDGRTVLVHVGIGTVDLAGKPFRLHVAAGDHVERDQLLLEADLDMIRTAGCSDMIIAAVLPQRDC